MRSRKGAKETRRECRLVPVVRVCECECACVRYGTRCKRNGAARRLTPPRQLNVERLRYFIVKSFATTLLNQELCVKVEVVVL